MAWPIPRSLDHQRVASHPAPQRYREIRGGYTPQGISLAKSPLKIIAVAFLSPRSGGPGPLLKPLSRSETLARLEREQAYGASLPQWHSFRRNILRLGGFEMLRGPHPAAGAQALRSLLQSA